MADPLRVRLHDAARALLDIGAADDLDEARLEAEVLYGEASGLDRAAVIARGADEPDTETLVRFAELLARRLRHEPLAYILGRRECYGMTFEVGRGVLIPRPETETLIEAGLAAVREHPSARRIVRVADVGTGSGVVALAIAKHALMAKVYGLDASTAALAVAGRNRKRFALMERVVLLAGDLLESLPERVDVVVANLPYVLTADIGTLAPEVRDWEPRGALDGGADGLDVIRALCAQVSEHLADGPRTVLLEVGAGQAAEVSALLRAAVGGEVRVHRDLAGIERVVEIRIRY
jgi:release factor glutamine methyltransferase